MWNQSYIEARVAEVPTMLLELLSHQNFADMYYGLDPKFRFVVSRAIYKGMLRHVAAQNRQEAVEMSRTLQLRFLQQQAAAARTEAEKLQAILEEGSSDAAVQAAVNVLKKQRPELLR